MKQQKILFRYMAAGTAILIATYLLEKIHIVTSDSVDPILYWKTNRKAVNGDYILFNFNIEDPLIPDVPVAMTKRLACTSGAVISYKDRNIYCNGHFLGYAQEKNHEDKELPFFYAPGLIPVNKALLFGDHPYSYDSRYWGFFDLTEPYTVIQPIL